MLHVATVSTGALLRITWFHTFPSIYDNTAFLPKPKFDIITPVTVAQLLRPDEFYLREKHGIQKHKLTSTFLDSLGSQQCPTVTWKLVIMNKPSSISATRKLVQKLKLSTEKRHQELESNTSLHRFRFNDWNCFMINIIFIKNLLTIESWRKTSSSMW